MLRLKLNWGRLKNNENEKEAFIREKIAEARKDDPNILETQIALLREQYGILYDITHLEDDKDKKAKEQLKTAREFLGELRSLEQLEKSLHRLRKEQIDNGMFGQEGHTAKQIEEVHKQYAALLETAIKTLEAMNSTDPAMRTILNNLKRSQLGLRNPQDAGEENNGLFAGAFNDYNDFANKASQGFGNGITEAFDNIGEKMDELVEDGKTKWQAFWQVVGDGKTVIKNVREAFLNFMADFLLETAKAILQQQFLNALLAVGGFLGLNTEKTPLLPAPVAHKGGIVGYNRLPVRNIDPRVFENARRFHDGGVAGLKSNEIPAILQRGEEVLTANDPRHTNNGGGVSSPNIKIVNANSSQEVVEEALASPDGERVVLNFIGKNRNKISSLLSN